MTDRLQNDVVFINVNGCGDWMDESTRSACELRLEKSKKINDYLLSHGLRSHRINPIDGDINYSPYFLLNDGHSIYTYNSYIIFELYNTLKRYNIDYSHLVLYQSDGFPINIDMWDDDFLQYDYIGYRFNESTIMGGGFSLRSKELMRVVSETFSMDDYISFIKNNEHGNEDVVFNEFGFIKKYPPTDIINKFSSHLPNINSFGFHTNNPFDFDHAISLWKHTK